MKSYVGVVTVEKFCLNIFLTTAAHVRRPGQVHNFRFFFEFLMLAGSFPEILHSMPSAPPLFAGIRVSHGMEGWSVAKQT